MLMRALRQAAVALLIAGLVVSMALLLAQHQETVRVKSDIAAEDPRDPDYVAALVAAALTRGNRYDVLTNGDQIFPAMLGAIDHARRRVSFETYVYDTGDV